MRLINVQTFKLEEFFDDQTPPYAILSHTWGDDYEELTWADVQDGRIDKPGVGSVKLRGSCRQAQKDNLGYVWVDTCCIDKANAVELGEAINSMYRWYQGASVCYAYLSDVPSNDIPRDHASKFRSSRWFQRGWTLQELLAPENLRFYNSDWYNIGTKSRLWAVLGEITGVPRQFLLGIAKLHTASVAQRMAWAAQRETKRREDLSYCLLGIFDVTMPMIYGEGGDQAFFRLQEQIMKTTRDDSILAWGFGTPYQNPRRQSGKVIPGRVLAAAPSDFARSRHIVSSHQPTTTLNLFDISRGSLRIHLPLLTLSPAGETFGLLNCGPEYDTQQVVGIPLTEVASGRADEYIRPKGCQPVLRQVYLPDIPTRLIHIKNDSPATNSANANRFYWLYDDDELTNFDLEVVDVLPPTCWQRDRAMIISTTQPNNNSSRSILIRLRHNNSQSSDFLLVLATAEEISADSQCSIMVCSRNTAMGELEAKLGYVQEDVLGKKSASNDLLSLHVTLEPDTRQPISMIKLERLPHPPDITIDATGEFRRLDLMMDLARALEEETIDSAKLKDLSHRIMEKNAKLSDVMKERNCLEAELRKLEKKLETCIKTESNHTEQIRHLTEAQVEIGQRREQLFARGSSALRQITTMSNIDGGHTHFDSQLFYDLYIKWVDVIATTDRSKQATSSQEQYINIRRALVAANVITIRPKDTEHKASPLIHSAANDTQTLLRLDFRRMGVVLPKH